MNFGTHLTHWRGKALKVMTRDELLEVIWELNGQYHSVRGDLERVRSKNQSSDYMVFPRTT